MGWRVTMSDIRILDQMIKDSAKVALTERHSKKVAVLTEHQQPDSVVTIAGMPDNAIIIKADVFKSPDTVFLGSKGECKRADYIIVADTGNKKTIICVEMKVTKYPKKEIIQQLAGAQYFIIYCQEIGKAFWNQSEFLKGYKYRFVSISHTGIPKRKTRVERPTGIHNRPEQMLKISSPHYLQFSHLAGS